jgi:hypothetical protein
MVVEPVCVVVEKVVVEDKSDIGVTGVSTRSHDESDFELTSST